MSAPADPLAEAPLPAAARPPPCPGVARCLAAGTAKALEELAASTRPDFADEGGWIRAVRIASRRLRVLLNPLRLPGDPHGVQAIRTELGQVQEDLSASRDLQVVRKWLRREAEDREGAEEELRQKLLAGGDEAPAEGGALQAATDERLAPWRARIREVLRAFLPEELHRPLPEGMPGVRMGSEAGDRLPPWKALRHPHPTPRERSQVRASLTHLMDAPLMYLDRVHDDTTHPEDLHDLRRDLRKMRYLAEALRYSFPELKKLREPLKHFVWLLGQVNDRRVIEELVGAEDHPGRGAMLARLDHEIREIMAEARAMTDGPLARGRLEKALMKLGG